jgi:hypothetical protein
MTDPARRVALDGTVVEPRPSASGGPDPRWGDPRRRRERRAAVHGDHPSAGTAQGSTDRPRPRSGLGAVRPEAAGPAPCVRDRSRCGIDHGVIGRAARRSSDIRGWRRGRYRCARIYGGCAPTLETFFWRAGRRAPPKHHLCCDNRQHPSVLPLSVAKIHSLWSVVSGIQGLEVNRRQEWESVAWDWSCRRTWSAI